METSHPKGKELCLLPVQGIMGRRQDGVPSTLLRGTSTFLDFLKLFLRKRLPQG
jgi:hypothetical protein